MHFSNNWFLAVTLFELFHKALQQIAVVCQIKYIPGFTLESCIMSGHNFFFLTFIGKHLSYNNFCVHVCCQKLISGFLFLTLFQCLSQKDQFQAADQPSCACLVCSKLIYTELKSGVTHHQVNNPSVNGTLLCLPFTGCLGCGVSPGHLSVLFSGAVGAILWPLGIRFLPAVFPKPSLNCFLVWIPFGHAFTGKYSIHPLCYLFFHSEKMTKSVQ